MTNTAETLVGDVLLAAANAAEANEDALIARIEPLNTTAIDAAAAFVESVIPSNGLFGSMLKGEIDAAIKAAVPKLVAAAGSEEKVVADLLIAAAKAEAKRLGAA